MREIIVTVTMRDFKGEYTDDIQKMFLRSIANQTYQNYKLIVTLYGEKNVENVLIKERIKHVCIPTKITDNTLSFTEIVSNAFQYLEKGKHIILHTNADNIFDKFFFQEIIDNFSSGVGGTSYPPVHYSSIDQFNRKESNHYRDYSERSIYVPFEKRKITKYFHQMDPNCIVPECVFIDGDVMLNKDNSKLFIDHAIVGAAMGSVLSYMLTFFCESLINIIFKSKVHSIETVVRNEKVNVGYGYNELKGEMFNDWKKNDPIVFSFMDKMGFDERLKVGTPLECEKHFIIRKYKPLGNLLQKIGYRLYLAINTFPFKVKGYWFPGEKWYVLPRYIIKKTILFFAHRKLLPVFVVKTIINRNDKWKKYFPNYSLSIVINDTKR
ncbi:hypothetical protein OAK09_02295 [Candidatus Marinimicrobia bacterium]|nr:hypothetical protein [Candidatus Neomarinimicrobiota bacterium]